MKKKMKLSLFTVERYAAFAHVIESRLKKSVIEMVSQYLDVIQNNCIISHRCRKAGKTVDKPAFVHQYRYAGKFP